MCAPGRDAGVLRVVVAGDDAGDVRAVAVVVVAACLPPVKSNDATTRSLQRLVVGDPRVDHRDADAAAGVAGQPADAAPHLVGAGRLRRDRHHPVHRARRPRGAATAGSAASAASCSAVTSRTAPCCSCFLTLRAVARRDRVARRRPCREDHLDGSRARRSRGDLPGRARAWRDARPPRGQRNDEQDEGGGDGDRTSVRESADGARAM